MLTRSVVTFDHPGCTECTACQRLPQDFIIFYLFIFIIYYLFIFIYYLLFIYLFIYYLFIIYLFIFIYYLLFIYLFIYYLFIIYLLFIFIYLLFIYYLLCVVLNQISLVCKVYYKYRKQTLLQKYLDHHGCLERRHDFTKDPSRSQKHCFL